MRLLCLSVDDETCWKLSNRYNGDFRKCLTCLLSSNEFKTANNKMMQVLGNDSKNIYIVIASNIKVHNLLNYIQHAQNILPNDSFHSIPLGIQRLITLYYSVPLSISVANMPIKQQEKIANRLNMFHTKKDLWKELNKQQVKIKRKVAKHCINVLNLSTQISQYSMDESNEKLKLIKAEIELETIYFECFWMKFVQLDSVVQKLKQYGTNRDVNAMRVDITNAFELSWRLRLCTKGAEKRRQIKKLTKCCKSNFLINNR
eukprot:236137_1